MGRGWLAGDCSSKSRRRQAALCARAQTRQLSGESQLAKRRSYRGRASTLKDLAAWEPQSLCDLKCFCRAKVKGKNPCERLPDLIRRNSQVFQRALGWAGVADQRLLRCTMPRAQRQSAGHAHKRTLLSKGFRSPLRRIVNDTGDRRKLPVRLCSCRILREKILNHLTRRAASSPPLHLKRRMRRNLSGKIATPSLARTLLCATANSHLVYYPNGDSMTGAGEFFDWKMPSPRSRK